MREYVIKYQELCADLNEGVSKEDIKKHNLAMKKLAKLFHQLEGIEDKSFVLELLYDADLRTSSMVAAHCLGWAVYITDAKKVLKKISKSKENPAIALNAEMTLEVYQEQGDLNF